MGKIIWVLLATHKIHPFCNLLHRNALVLCAYALIPRTALKLSRHNGTSFNPKCIKCRLLAAGTARTRWGTEALHGPLSRGWRKSWE